eukprot:12834602-Alexandrium_andersonii.AAC.1
MRKQARRWANVVRHTIKAAGDVDAKKPRMLCVAQYGPNKCCTELGEAARQRAAEYEKRIVSILALHKHNPHVQIFNFEVETDTEILRFIGITSLVLFGSDQDALFLKCEGPYDVVRGSELALYRDTMLLRELATLLAVPNGELTIRR